jgi:hypothetical protein
MSRFFLHHRHTPSECRIVFASWKGVASPLRHRATLSSCAWGGHEIWWDTEAANEEEALGQLPTYVAERTRATRIGEVEFP